MTERRDHHSRELVWRAFRRAVGDLEPDVSRIAGAVPTMMAEARRLRLLESRAGTIASIVPLARRVIPALAAVAAALVLIATFVGSRETSVTVNGTADIERLILTGEVQGGPSDVLLGAMTEKGNDNG